MARGVRKTTLEKYKEDLAEVNGFIEQYNEILRKKKEKKKEIEELIRIEELNELSQILEEKNISVDELKTIIDKTNK